MVLRRINWFLPLCLSLELINRTNCSHRGRAGIAVSAASVLSLRRKRSRGLFRGQQSPGGNRNDHRDGRWEAKDHFSLQKREGETQASLLFQLGSASVTEVGADSACSSSKLGNISRDECFARGGENEECMWLRLEDRNLCLPCKTKKSGIPLPCPPISSVFAMKKVQDCQMQCDHQQVTQLETP
jgi:hypothetical protein